MLYNGLYEQVVYELLGRELDSATEKIALTQSIDPAEASLVLTKYVAEVVRLGLEQLIDAGGDLSDQVSLSNQIVSLIRSATDNREMDGLRVDERALQLLALDDRTNRLLQNEEAYSPVRPVSSLSISSVFTGAVREPSLFSEFRKEIRSCDRIDMLVSFIKWSGLRLIIDDLREFTLRGGALRVITTSYMGATDLRAIEELRQLTNTQIKISYDTKRTRLHAKTYAFYRNSGFSTAYIGSSNLSNAAISSGLEWNVKITAKDLPDTLEKVSATFESYWHSSDFELYQLSERDRLQSALKAEKYFGRGDDYTYLFDIHPYAFQTEILEKLSAERTVRQLYRNLIVAATGTGKTVISAFDYKRFMESRSRSTSRLLFVAHREEILKQSLACYRGVLGNPNFGDLYVGNNRPESIDHLFMSIQTLNSQRWVERVTADFYDFIVVDEFHHAAAPSYQALMHYFNPSVLLGLTATPERMDGLNITGYFSGRIAAEIRLPEAIDRKLLSPFQYFGVTDTVDLADLRWTRGGYDRAQLSNLYSYSTELARQRCAHIIRSLQRYVSDIAEVRGLGFCVSVEHARFMSDFFNEHGIPAMHLTGESSDADRNSAKVRLVVGELKFIFVVDLYNEGVDIPEVNTVLFLRPTESLTIFLQQLGRGLRLSEGKECLTVLDFIGQANRKYNFEEKLSALLDSTGRSVQSEIRNGFVSVPKGCSVQLERKAKEYVLSNIRQSIGLVSGLVSRIATFEEDTGVSLSLSSFLRHYHMDVRSIYRRGSFSRLSASAGVREDFIEPLEETMSRAFRRLCTIDSRRWLAFLLQVLKQPDLVAWEALTNTELSMLQMFCQTVWQVSGDMLSREYLQEKLKALSESPTMLAELRDLLAYLHESIDFVDEPVNLGFDSPLDLHCTYTRDQLLIGLGFLNPGSVREGVKWLPDKKCDIFFITLNKSEKEYSPTTMYRDYSINEGLFHWQSQSTTSAESPTGKRYQSHGRDGNKVLLFVRESKSDEFGTTPYSYLGLASYMEHTGSSPMSITYRMHRPIPAKFLKITNQLLVG